MKPKPEPVEDLSNFSSVVLTFSLLSEFKLSNGCERDFIACWKRRDASGFFPSLAKHRPVKIPSQRDSNLFLISILIFFLYIYLSAHIVCNGALVGILALEPNQYQIEPKKKGLDERVVQICWHGEWRDLKTYFRR